MGVSLSTQERMAQQCKATGGAGLKHTKGYEDTVNSKISGELNEVESNLPDNIKDRAVSVFKSAVSQSYPIIDVVEKVQKEALCEVETVFKGQRFKEPLQDWKIVCYQMAITKLEDNMW